MADNTLGQLFSLTGTFMQTYQAYQAGQYQQEIYNFNAGLSEMEATMITQETIANAALVRGATEFNVGLLEENALFNAGLITQNATYNVGLLMDEAAFNATAEIEEARYNGRMVMLAARIRADQVSASGHAVIHDQRVAYAKSGVISSAGTPLEVMANSAATIERDMGLVMMEGKIQTDSLLYTAVKNAESNIYNANTQAKAMAYTANAQLSSLMHDTTATIASTQTEGESRAISIEYAGRTAAAAAYNRGASSRFSGDVASWSGTQDALGLLMNGMTNYRTANG